MAEKFKKSIYLTGKLIEIYDECKNKKRSRSFSGRMADIAERYDILIGLTDIPELTEEEQMILGACLSGSFMQKVTIKYLPDAIRDSGLMGNEELAQKVEPLDYVQRMALIEKLGI